VDFKEKTRVKVMIRINKMNILDHKFKLYKCRYKISKITIEEAIRKNSYHLNLTHGKKGENY
jgi:hypothetical protein